MQKFKETLWTMFHQEAIAFPIFSLERNMNLTQPEMVIKWETRSFKTCTLL